MKHDEQDHNTHRLAFFISELFGPGPLGSVLLFCGGVRGQLSWHSVLASAIAIIFITAGPFGALLYLSRRGSITDHHVGARKQRAPVLAGVLASLLVGCVVLVVIRAESQLWEMIIGLAIGLIVVGAINLVWKLSIHAAVSAYFVLALIALYGPWATAFAWVPLVVGWSRVRLGSHTWPQVFAGWAAGILVGMIYACVLRPLL